MARTASTPADAIAQVNGIISEQEGLISEIASVLEEKVGGGLGPSMTALNNLIGGGSADNAMSNGFARSMCDEIEPHSWSGVRPVADGADIKDGVAFLARLKGKTVGGVNSKPEAIVSGSYNLLDESVIFANEIWARSDEGYSALTNVINGQYGGAKGFMSGFKANTQYTISWKAKASTSSSRIRINYTDGSYGLVCRTTLVGEFEELNGTSQSGKTIDRISFDYAGANTTTIAWLQIEEGTTVTKHGRYMAPYRLDLVLPSIFADGLASAGDIYDEIDYLHNVAIKRVGVVEPIIEPIDAKAWYKVASGGSEEAVCGNGVPLVAEIAYRKDYTEILNDYELAKTLI